MIFLKLFAISYILGLSTEEVNGNSILFMIAGYETTATTLTFAAYCLATYPKCQEKLIMEIDATIAQVLHFPN
jgi:cytochrome P450